MDIFNDLDLVLQLNQHIQEIAESAETNAAILSQQTSFKVFAQLDSIANPDPRVEAQFDHQLQNFHVAGASDLPFHLQGDQAFNAAAVLVQRRALRHSVAVQDKIAFLWTIAHGRKAAEQANTKQVVPASESSVMNEPEYVEMMLLIFKALREDFVMDTAKKQIHCDWEVDSHRNDTLSYDQFFAALFELVDVWTCDVLETTYVRFLDLLTRRITLRVVVFLDDMRLKLALSDNFDPAVVVKAIPLSTIKRFAPVAKVVESRGMKTVGELASADPRVIENERIAFLKRGEFSRDKIGGDMLHLLNMFREISKQLGDGTNGASSIASPSSRLLGPAGGNTLVAVQGDTATGYLSARQSAFGSAEPGPSQPSDPFRSRRLDAAMATQPLGSSGLAEERSHLSFDHQDQQGNGASARESRGFEPSSSSAPEDTTLQRRLPAVNEASNVRDGETSSCNPVTSVGADCAAPRRGLRRINTFHDLSITESGVLDAVKTSFLIEKSISLQRKQDLDEIAAELTKFGVDTAGMSPSAMGEKYSALYEMFVVPSGEDIRSVAQSVLARIKLELAAHGIDVPDDEVEATYDDFYRSVVAGSGDEIVTDAKNWIEQTTRNNGADAYIKREYHELKPIDDVQVFGTHGSDQEFLSLVGTDTETTPEEGSPVGPMSRTASLLRNRSSLHGFMESPPSPSEGERCDVLRGQSRIAGSDLPAGDSHSLDSDSAADTFHAPMDPGCEHWSNTQSSSRNVGLSSPSQQEAESIETEPPSPAATTPLEMTIPGVSQAVELETQAIQRQQELDQGLPSQISPICRLDAESSGAEADAAAALSVAATESPMAEDASSQPLPGVIPTETDDAVELGFPDEAERQTHCVVPVEQDRAALGVEFEHESKQPMQISDPARKSTSRGSVLVQPRVPRIFVGGAESSQSVAITARYLQLLGIGTVTTVGTISQLVEALTVESLPVDLVCFDVGAELELAVAWTRQLCEIVGKSVIMFGGDNREQQQTLAVANNCVEAGALYFAVAPIDFARLRKEILQFFETSTQPLILRHRRSTRSLRPKALSSPIQPGNAIDSHDSSTRKTSTLYLHSDSNKASSRRAVTPLPIVSGATKAKTTAFHGLVSRDAKLVSDPVTFTPVAPLMPRSKKQYPRFELNLHKLLR